MPDTSDDELGTNLFQEPEQGAKRKKPAAKKALSKKQRQFPPHM
jgi:hypothetical protein